ncbi:MAG: VanZ family protein [Clostridiaceae bacterium]|mgnify:CR=1 FL=1|jgi:VanZ family protein|nr:VanZ family protein [Clostridiaceae bacterium]
MRKKSGLMLMISTTLVIAMVLIIFAFSTQQGESSIGTSESIIDSLIQKLGIESFIENNEWLYEHRNIVFRKTLHFFEYAILATLTFITLKLRGLKLKYISIITLMFTSMIAAVDEYYQSLIPGRTPHIRDVFIDTLGAFTAIIIILIIIKLFKRSKKDEAYQ